MPDRSHHGGEADQDREIDIADEDHLLAEVEAGQGAPRDPGDTVEAKVAPKVDQESEARRKEDTAEVKAALDPNPEKNQEKAGPSLNQNPGLKRTTPVLRRRVEASQEKTVVQSPNPDREVTD